MKTHDVVVVGGGLVGSAIALGLSRQGLSVCVLDEGDQAFRASRGNFGLVWVQGKGMGLSPYAAWSMRSAGLWPSLAATLKDTTGIDVVLQQRGGLHLCLSQDELTDRQQNLAWLQSEIGPSYQYDMLDPQQLKELLPQIGPEVAGASFTPMDGHVNPLKLLLSLHTALKGAGVTMNTEAKVQRIERDGNGFICHTARGSWASGKVVLAAGLANNALGKQLGLNAPVRPNRGQVLITERLPEFMRYPTNYVRQTDEGTIQIGDSQEDAGFDDQISTSVLSGIASRAIRCFPLLKQARLVRSWAALRIMSPDGFPIYEESQEMPGAYVTTCHSGVTLAACHAFVVAPWIAGQDRPADITPFSAARFNPGEPRLTGDYYAG